MSLSRILAAFFAAAFLAMTAWAQSLNDRLDDSKVRVAELVQQNETAKAIAQVRADSAKQVLDVALITAKANHTEAVRLLNIPTPPPEERCKAASELVDQVIQKERQ